MAEKYVYVFGPEGSDGDASMKNLLGGKGANLAEMAGHPDLKLPVPAGFTLTTDVCTYFMQSGGQYPPGLRKQVADALSGVEKAMGKVFGDPQNPLLVSSRSGARQSMPGMMETVLNVGLCSKTIPGLVKQTGDARFVYDAYRRLITMYADVVMEKAEGKDPEEEAEGIRAQLEDILDGLKKFRMAKSDTDLDAEDLKQLCEVYKVKVKDVLGCDFPDDPEEQLWGAIAAVFKSWNGKRAKSFRRIEGIPDDWGTACNVQSMVFGNMGKTSATGVAFTRDPATGTNLFYGEWLMDAQGEDVVAGIRTPAPLKEQTRRQAEEQGQTKDDQGQDETKDNQGEEQLPSLETAMPGIYEELVDIRNRLEAHYTDMQDIEFTIEKGKLWMLQTRVGKRTGIAALTMAMEMLDQGMIDEETAVMRVAPRQLDALLHPLVDPDAEKVAEKEGKRFATGLPAGPGGARGQIVFSSADAVAWAREDEKRKEEEQRGVILVREETNPEDVEGMRAAQGILTARGGMTSHAALVARGWGKCCIVGAGALRINARAKTITVEGKTLRQGDIITLNGTGGFAYEGALKMIDPTEDPHLKKLIRRLMDMAEKHREMGVRTNADTPEDARLARKFGAEGIGLFRTEHMFYGEGADEAKLALQKTIVSQTKEERRAALQELFPLVKEDIKATLEAMDGLPVTIRLLDPPLHEFVPQSDEGREKLAKAMGISVEDVLKRGEALHEVNPMMGHRGVRLGITYPEITEMQVRAIFEAAAELINAGKTPYPEIMVPVTCAMPELDIIQQTVDEVYEKVCKETGTEVEYLYGTMIEIPRACLTADKMAKTAEFFSFGTNDLTQMGFGFSRDDIAGFLPDYVQGGILKADPFQTIDQEGIGQLVRMAVERGRAARADLKIGICGEQGGDAASVDFCFRTGLNYVSCSPHRVPIARLAAAQAAIAAKK